MECHMVDRGRIQVITSGDSRALSAISAVSCFNQPRLPTSIPCRPWATVKRHARRTSKLLANFPAAPVALRRGGHLITRSVLLPGPLVILPGCPMRWTNSPPHVSRTQRRAIASS